MNKTWIEALVLFESPAAKTAEELISDLFIELGLSGVVVEDPDLSPEEGWGDDAIGPPERRSVTGYIPGGPLAGSRMARLEAGLARLSASAGFTYSLVRREISEEDWAESWKAHFAPVRIGRRIIVKPTWREAEVRSGDIVIELDPGMAFGTGTHPTTAMCMALLEDLTPDGGDVLDVGTGSGILMATAALIGARFVAGVDNDPVAVSVARCNLMRNHIPENRFLLAVGDLAAPVKGRFDLVCANILAEVVALLAPAVPGLLKPGGIFLASGIIEEKTADVLAALEDVGLIPESVHRDGGWVAVVSCRRG